MEKVDLTKLNDDKIKALIYDEQNRVLLSQNNIKALEQELLRRLKEKQTANMVENVPSVTAPAVDVTEKTEEKPKEGE